MSQSPTACIYCNRTAQIVPLLQFEFQGEQYWICPQHLPILIHQPAQLAGKVKGFESLEPSEVTHGH